MSGAASRPTTASVADLTAATSLLARPGSPSMLALDTARPLLASRSRVARAWRHPRLASLALGWALGLVLVGCADEPITAPTAVASVTAATQPPPTAAALDSLARALALGLAAPAARQALLEDLRDSPFPLNKLHLGSYLAGARGAVLLERSAQASRVPQARLAQIAASARDYELWVPSVVHRVSWTGTDDIMVFATTLSVGDLLRSGPTVIGYGVTGDPEQIALMSLTRRPYIAIAPARQDFGDDPEVRRAAAPKAARGTISTKIIESQRRLRGSAGASTSGGGSTASLPHLGDGDQRIMTEGCEEGGSENCCEEGGESGMCDGSGGHGPVSYPGTVLNFSFNDCVPASTTATEDADRDGIVDTCESTLATTFEPRLQFHSGETHADRESFYYTVNRSNDGARIRIFYALAYFYDPGYSLFSSDDHLGDSEFLIVQVGPYAGSNSSIRWQVQYVTYSAHFGGAVDETQTYHWTDVHWYNGQTGLTPRIWVAVGKHANYRTDWECDQAAASLDDCNDGGYSAPVGVVGSMNLGNEYLMEGWSPTLPTQLINCTTSVIGYWSSTQQYCFWNDSDLFTGWYPAPAPNASGSYGALFDHLDF